jgi:hypothetical protein
VEDSALQLLQRLAGLEPEFLIQDAAGQLEYSKGVGLPLGPVQRQHELAVEGLPQRVLGGQRVQLTDTLAMTAQQELRVNHHLDGLQAKLRQPGGESGEDGTSPQVAEYVPPPQAEGVFENGSRACVTTLAHVFPADLHQFLERIGVKLTGLDSERVAR